MREQGSNRSSISISFDFETSAQSQRPSWRAKVKAGWFHLSNGLGISDRDLSSGHGRGYGNRVGTQRILKLFSTYDIKATWFATGHVLLKENRSRDAFRINQRLEYAVPEAGFTGASTFRKNNCAFYHEPYDTYKKHPWFYLGDLVEEMIENGQDIQCHTFSHPYISMESPENIQTDLEDWQNTAEQKGFEKSTIFAFPFLGDFHYEEISTGLKTVPYFRNPQLSYKRVYLSEATLNIFIKNGFELFTRCGSLESQDDLFGFISYRGSQIYCIKNKGLLGFANIDSFKKYLNKVIETPTHLDLWLHPNDILCEGNQVLFESIVKELVEMRDKGIIRLCTIKEQWEEFKKKAFGRKRN